MKHLQVDTKTLLENNRALLDVVDCSHVGNPTAASLGGYVNLFIVAQLNGIRKDDVADNSTDIRPRVSSYLARSDKDPFPDPSLLDPIDSEKNDEISSSVTTMVAKVTGNGLPDAYRDQLSDIVDSNIDIFPTFFFPWLQ